MTREELVQMREYKVAQASTEYWNKNKDNDEVSIMTAFEDGVDWADDNPKDPWVYVHEETPETERPVNMIVEVNGNQYLKIGHYDTILKKWSTGDKVIKWMYIPNSEGLIYKIA